METEIRLATKQRADAEAIRVFADNLRQLLLAPPLGQKRVLGIDPGFRTGCKVVCLDAQGKLFHNETIYPNLSEKAREQAAERIRTLCAECRIEAIAVGNGTAGRETETFLRGLDLPATIQVIMVNESGASVYSASKIARDEFPDHDVTVRGAVSIGRRLMDPLAELVKIDPKAIGVGQYQHDVDQAALKQSLEDVVMSCVNAVGVELNTASAALLTYVSGLGPALAGNIVAWRERSRPLPLARGAQGCAPAGGEGLRPGRGLPPDPRRGESPRRHRGPSRKLRHRRQDGGRPELLRRRSDARRGAPQKRIDPARYVTEEIGLPTLNDILAELAKPGRDPRAQFEAFRFADGVEKIEDLTPGMKLPGIVTNITAFGAFVDIGVHQDGLVHLSQIADRFVKDAGEVLKVRQVVEVTVLAVDMERTRISLTMRKNPEGGAASDHSPADKKEKPAVDSRQRGREKRADRPPRAEEKPAEGAQQKPGEGKPAPKQIVPGKPAEERPTDGRTRDRRGKPDQGRPQRIKPRDEKVPFNNPFAEFFKKK